MSFTPWSHGPRSDGLWICQEDKDRIDRYNSKLRPEDEEYRMHYTIESGQPMIPGMWCGNPYEARLILLMLNPAVSEENERAYAIPELKERLENSARGQWDPEYPNAWLHPLGRKAGPWCATVVFGALHKHLVSNNYKPEEAWSRIANRCAVLELSPWASHKWSPNAIISSSSLSISLAKAAMADKKRLVLLARGEDQWHMAGLIDADTLPKSKGVRSNQSRITPANFPDVWPDIIAKIE